MRNKYQIGFAALLVLFCATAQAQWRVVTPYGNALHAPGTSPTNGQVLSYSASIGQMVWSANGSGGAWSIDQDAGGKSLTNVASITSSSSAPFFETLGDGAGHTLTRAMPTNTLTGNFTMVASPLSAFAGALWYDLSGGVMTPRAGVGGTDLSTPTSTDTFQNKTFDAAATGNTIKFKSYIPFLTPGFADGIGAIPNTNDYTVATFGHYKFSGSAATNANYVVYGPISVPTDIDTSVDLRARLKVRLSATETSASTFNLGVQDVADSASGSFAGSGNWVAVAIAADGSGAANDLETSAWITLTGWKSALTADHAMFIVLNRDGAGDAANTGIWEAELKIEYGVTQ